MGGLGTPVRSEIGRYQCRTVSSLCRICSPLLLRRIARNPGPIASRRTAFRRRESAVTMMLVAIACQRHQDVAVEQTKNHVPCPIALRLPRSLLLAPSSVIERLRLLRLHRDLRAILIPLNQIPKLGNRPRPYSRSEVIHRAGDESLFPAFERERPRIVNNFAASASSGYEFSSISEKMNSTTCDYITNDFSLASFWQRLCSLGCNHRPKIMALLPPEFFAHTARTGVVIEGIS
jgi:hypothetical protein